MSSNWRRSAGGILILVGAGLLIFAAGSVLDRKADQRQAREGLRLAPLEDGADTAKLHRDDSSEGLPSLHERVEPGSVVGRIRIESAGVDVVALEGIGKDVLRKAAGHFPGTALPGRPGNASFAAHRDSYFRGLRHVGVGDSIEVETASGTFSYRVSETRIVEPEAVEVVAPRGGSELTLVTCFPFDFVGPAPRRFVVHAQLLTS